MLHRGHVLTFSDAETNLKSFGEYLYDNIILFAPKRGEFSSVSVEDLKEFIDDGGDMLFIANGEVSDGMRLLAATCGVEFDKKGSFVIDHVNFDKDLDSR
jgi:oligosaccharyltransferase complex subunit beta